MRCERALVTVFVAMLACGGERAIAAAPDDAPDGIVWDALVEEIERSHPLMAAARAGLDAFGARLDQARWLWFPSLKMDVGFGPTPAVNGVTEEVDFGRWGVTTSLSLTLVQPLFTFGKIGAMKEAASHGVDVGLAQLTAARLELRHRAAQAFNGALMAREIRTILTDGEVWLKKAEARMARLKAEDSEDYDQLEHLRLKTRAAEFYQLEANNNLLHTTSQEGLRVLLSRPAGAPAVIASSTTFAPTPIDLLPVERYVDRAMAQATDLRAVRSEASAREALADAKQAELWPSLVLMGEATLGYSTSTDGPWSITDYDPAYGHGARAAGLLGLRWGLDVPQKLFKRDAARAEARAAREKVAVTEDLLEVKVRSLHQELADKRRLLDILARSQRAARGWLTSAWDVYDAGFGEFRNVMDALVQFYGKRLAYLQVVYEHNVLIATLSRTVGEDIIRLGAAVDASTPAP